MVVRPCASGTSARAGVLAGQAPDALETAVDGPVPHVVAAPQVVFGPSLLAGGAGVAVEAPMAPVSEAEAVPVMRSVAGHTVGVNERAGPVTWLPRAVA